MSEYVILCVDDERPVLDAVLYELEPFSSQFYIEGALSVEEARSVVEQIKEDGDKLALIVCDNIMPKTNGIDFLIELGQEPYTHRTSKVLLTGQTSLDETVAAINQGCLDYYIGKPWLQGELIDIARKQLAKYIVTQEETPFIYAKTLSQDCIMKAQMKKQVCDYQQGFIDYTNKDQNELSAKLIDTLYDFFHNYDKQNVCESYGADHVLFHEGDMNNFLWFIVSGEVLLKKRNIDQTEEVVSIERHGSLSGLMSFVTGEPSYATVITSQDTEVIKLDRNQFAQIMEANSQLLPLFTNLLMKNFHHRLKVSFETELQLQNTLRTLKSTQDRLIESEKMVILGQLVAGVAHELNNPIAAIIRAVDAVHEHVTKLAANKLSSEFKLLGNKVMEQGLRAEPISTENLRKRTKQAGKHFLSSRDARMAVQMNLDDENNFKRYFKGEEGEVSDYLKQLNHYYTTGVFMHNMDSCAKRIADLVNSLKSYVRRDAENAVRVNLLQGIEDTLLMFDNKLKHYEVVKNFQEIPLVECFPSSLQQVWTNLINNAIDASGETGVIKIDVSLLPAKGDNQQWVKLCFADNGHGIPAEIQKKIFELNFTTKREGNFGLGIGLNLCAQIIHHHNGLINVESEPGKETVFTITLPVDNPNLQAMG
jgi:signal transduction histidine kinase/FixJ family two-component response regulator